MTERLTSPEANLSLLDERLSLGASIVLLLLYAANLIYALVTHRTVFAPAPWRTRRRCGAYRWVWR